MNGYKKNLWPFMAAVELILLLLNWAVAFISPKLGDKFYRWNQKVLPDSDWYNSVDSTAADAHSDCTKIGSRVAAARDQAGYTQEALSRRLGFKDRQTLSAIESGTRKIGPEELIAIMELTGKELDFFSDPYRLDGEGEFSFRTTSEELK